MIDEKIIGRGKGKSKKKSEQEAARDALATLYNLEKVELLQEVVSKNHYSSRI
ncbi:MAG: putative dsRNA-binding protein [Actinomycetota bacterium]|nr:putative dsRNA-binding protein [Actinomycetota bacterium]